MSSIADERTSGLARLAVHLGANVAPGRDVVVLAFDIEHAALAVATRRSGVARVRGWWDRQIEELIERRGAQIVLWGDPHIDLLADIDPARAGHDTMPLTGATHAMHGGGEVNWTFVPAPTSAAAERIVGTEDVDALWEVLTPILRLDADDPEDAWRRHMDRLAARAAALNERSFAGLRFHGPGTDLKVGLMDRARWFCARFDTTWGRPMIANMPTEEVFTTPDNRIAEGMVTATRPIPLLGGATMEGLRLRFEDGRVVSVDADRNADALRSVLGSDPGAARLGEVALVDGTSPVGRSGRVFSDILLDENATCHIALGNGYPFTVPDLPGDAGGRAERGFNVSGIHQDMMIGGPEIAVDGLDAAGSATPILRDDVWVL